VAILDFVIEYVYLFDERRQSEDAQILQDASSRISLWDGDHAVLTVDQLIMICAGVFSDGPPDFKQYSVRVAIQNAVDVFGERTIGNYCDAVGLTVWQYVFFDSSVNQVMPHLIRNDSMPSERFLSCLKFQARRNC